MHLLYRLVYFVRVGLLSVSVYCLLCPSRLLGYVTKNLTCTVVFKHSLIHWKVIIPR
jgi:hypothetical protein